MHFNLVSYPFFAVCAFSSAFFAVCVCVKLKGQRKANQELAFSRFSVFGFRFVRVECVERHKRQCRTGEMAEPPPPESPTGGIFIDSHSLFFPQIQLSKTTTNSCHKLQLFCFKINLILVLVDIFYYDTVSNYIFGLK